MVERAAPLPIPLSPHGRAWTLLAAAACLLPLLLQLPGGLALGIAVTGSVVALLSWRRPLPSWLRLLLALALIGVVLAVSRFGFGRDTACALLAAMLAIKPGEVRSLRDGRSLLGFALFAPFATFLLDQGPLSLLLGLLAATLAFAALLRLAELESGDGAHRLSARQRILGVWRLVVIGLPLALAAFWLFPRIATPMWGVPDRAMARPGLSDRMSPGAWLDLLNDDSTAARVRFFGATPPTTQMYWRGPVLWNFDGRTWTTSRWMAALPPAPVDYARDRQWDYELELEPTDRRQLIALDLPTSAPEGTQLALDYGLWVPSPLDKLSRWRMRASPPRRFEPQLRSTLRAIALALPQGYNPRTLALARQWRRDAGNDDAAIVRRALQMIHDDFAYTLATELPGRDSVDEFLFDTRAGYCEHFSSSFVVLMRAAGIPARVVTGYVGGYFNAIGGYWQVRRSDAHAWAEVWLPGSGWTRVDPTAAVAPERIYDTLGDRAPASGLLDALPALSPVLDASDWLRRGWNDFMLGFDAARQRRMLQSLGMRDVDSRRLVSLFVLAAALALLWMVWLTTRAERERDPLLAAWHRLGRRYARLGLARAPDEPALAWAARVKAARPRGTASAESLAALSARFVEWRYAPGNGEKTVPRPLLRDLDRHRP